MSKKIKYIAEQEILIWRSESEQKRVVIRISEPQIEKDPRHGDDVWACYPKLENLVDSNKAIYGYTSFQALICAIQVCRQIIRDESKGAKIFMIGDKLGDDEAFKDIIPLKELFGMD